MLKERIRTIPDFPKKGIQFRDVTTLLKDPVGLTEMAECFYEQYKNTDIDYVAGIEARGFIVGAIIADRLKKGFIPIRKPGKLPGEKIRLDYDLEYGKDAVEIHKDALSHGDKVLLVDDLLATGGTALASIKLIEKLGAVVSETAFIVNLPDLKGQESLEKNGYRVFSLCAFEGD